MHFSGAPFLGLAPMRVGPVRCDARKVPLRCLIVDDNPRFGEAARSLLEREGISVVGVALSGDDAVRLAASLLPDLALVDISLGRENGFDVARRLVDGSRPGAPAVILISTHDEREFSARIEESSALGFMPKTRLSAARIRELLGA